MIDPDRLRAAYEKVRHDLLSERGPQQTWMGRLSSSPFATATAISALVLAEQHGRRVDGKGSVEEVYQGDLSELIVGGLYWLARHQNPDGGWGDTDKSFSNIAATMLVTAAFHLTGVPAKYSGMLERAELYLRQQGGAAALRRRYGKDRTIAVPILANAALADLVSWNEVAPLPFELACFPQPFYRRLGLPVVSHAIPALVAVGLARYVHAKPINPLWSWIRRAAVEPSLQVLRQMQPESGGFLEAVPLTSFVVMCLASAGRARDVVVRRGVEFLLAGAREDGSWPMDANLAVRGTALSVLALRGAATDRDPHEGDALSIDCLDWLLAAQHRERHPITGSAPGGWACTDMRGAAPDAFDTAGALLALACWPEAQRASRATQIQRAAHAGIRWLLDLQSADGGWPTYCRGWGKLPFDRSTSDVTAHALRALAAWRGCGDRLLPTGSVPDSLSPANAHWPDDRIARAIERGFDFLVDQQLDDGSWVPLWFGNEHHPHELNAVYGTARVLMALRELNLLGTAPARRAISWLLRWQHTAGGWSGGRTQVDRSGAGDPSSVEETALAIEALVAAEPNPSLQEAIEQGVAWLVEAVETDRHREAAPIGFSFTKLWYYERLYPLIFTVSALGRAVARSCPQPREFCPPNHATHEFLARAQALPQSGRRPQPK